MKLLRGDGAIQVSPDTSPGNSLCHVCSSGDAVMAVNFNSPRREQATKPKEPGQVYIRLCSDCLTTFAKELLK